MFSGWQVLNMGIELLPQITSNEAVITLSTDARLSKEESYVVAGKAVEAAMAVDNVTEVGIDVYKRQLRRALSGSVPLGIAS